MLSWIDIDAAAVRHNYRQFCKVAGRERVAPVLKANAYGHGLKEIYRGLELENPPWICVNYVAEALALRRLSFKGRLLVVGPAVIRELKDAEAAQADIIVGNHEVLKAWIELNPRVNIHLKFDTGMSRQGFQPSEALALAERLKPHRERVVGICTHFANVEDVTDHEYARLQLKKFNQAVSAFSQLGYTLLKHAASSASLLLLDESRFDLVRLGISLYGLWPSQATKISYLQLKRKLLDLRPVLSWHTEVTTVKSVTEGQYIGYGCTYRAVRDMRIVVLPVGYYEGYPRLAGGRSSHVLIRGERCPLVGRICMNMMMVDVTHLKQVKVGDVVTLIGQDDKETIAAADVAAWAETIHYELVSRLNQDIPRSLVGLR